MRFAPWGRRLAAAAVVGCAALTAFQGLHDWDMFHHLAYGRDVLQRGGFASEDPFLFPLAGLPSGPQPSWLGSVVIYLSWRLGGDAGPLWLAAAASALLFALLLADAAEADASPAGLAAALAPLGLALALHRGRAVPRPELLASLLLAATAWALRREFPGRPRLLWALPLALVLWANLHQSVLAGLVVIALFVLSPAPWRGAGAPAPRPSPAAPRARLVLAGLALAGVLAAGLTTPVGFAPFASPVRAVALWLGGSATAGTGPGAPTPDDPAAVLGAAIAELQPWRPGALDPYTWLLALTAASFALAAVLARRLEPRELLLCLAFAGLGLRVGRFGALAGLVLAPIAARNLRAALDAAGAGARRALRFTAPAAALAVGAVPAAGSFDAAPPRLALGPGRELPVRAVDYLRQAAVPARLYNTFHFGGYLEWRLDQQVYQDGRGAVRPDEARAALLGPVARQAFEPLDARHRFDALLVEPPSFEPDLLATLATRQPDEDWAADRRRWALVAFDDGGLLYLRRDGALAGHASRDEYRFARPAVPPGVGAADLAGLRADLGRSVREAPGCALCQNLLGFVDLAEGRLDAAQAAFQRALPGAPAVRAQARWGLEKVAALRGAGAGTPPRR